MADDAKELLVRVSATTELLRSNLIAAERAVADFERKTNDKLGQVDKRFDALGVGVAKMNNAFKAAAVSAGGFVAAIGIGSLVGAGQQILEFADNLATAADQAGLSTERYQTLKEALRTLEIPADKADKVFKTLYDTLGKVQSGAKDGATKALDALGISSRILSGEITDTGGLIDALAASAKNAGTEAQFASRLVDIFGKKIGVDLAAALRDGGANLRQLESDFKSSGNVISSETVQRLAEANEAVDRFVASSRQTLTIWAGDVITFAGRAWAALRGIDNFDDGRGDIGTRVTTISKRVAEARRELEALEGRKVRGIGAAGAGNRRKLLQSQIDEGEAQIADLIARGRIEVAAFNNKPAISPAPSGGSGSGRASRPAEDTISKMVERVDIVIRNSSIAADDLYRKIGINEDSLVQKQTANIDKVAGYEYEARKDAQVKALEAAQRVGEAQVRTLSILFEDGFRGGVKAIWRDFENIGLQVVANVLAQMVAGQSGGGIGGMFSRALGGVLGFADGGVPPVGRVSVVGERGPELFVPKVPGTIIPNHALGGGQSNLSVTINAPGATAETVARIRQEIAAAAPTLIAAATQNTARTMSRKRL